MAYRRLAAVTAAAAAGPAVAQETYAFDDGHTEIRFSWSHAGITTQSAEFEAVDGEVVIDRADVANSRVDVTLDAELTFDGPHPLGAFMDEYDAYYTGFEATATVLRSPWDLGMFAPPVSDAVDTTIRTELRRVDGPS